MNPGDEHGRLTALVVSPARSTLTPPPLSNPGGLIPPLLASDPTTAGLVTPDSIRPPVVHDPALVHQHGVRSGEGLAIPTDDALQLRHGQPPRVRP